MTTEPIKNTDISSPGILPQRQRAKIRNDWLKERLDTLLPELMHLAKIDMWVVIAREYNEDPVIMSLLPEPNMNARRRTMLVFALTETGVECLHIGKQKLKGYYKNVWEETSEKQFACLQRIIREKNPKTVGINVSHIFPFGDGLSHSLYLRLMEELGPFSRRIKSAEKLCVAWLETRIKPELSVYPDLVNINHAIIREAFSRKVISPGVTTVDDVAWWMRQKITDLGLRAWFQPTVDLQARDVTFSDENPRRTILPGDMLHCDIGFSYLGLNTDNQQLAYVLKDGETDAPEGLKQALTAGNQLQDILAGTMKTGMTGNQILKEARQNAKAAGLDPSIYTHPLGYHGHGAGPVIGLYDNQEGISGNGDYPLNEDTVYAIELNVKRNIPEWGDQPVAIYLEEDAKWSNGELTFLGGRQKALHLIGPNA
ncbi:MAG: aminopeptidase P family protein [Desulfobacteraceae bacterium]|nr:aminopeptidase P family protein [Desulfobacteraceae bacterium]